MLPPSLQRPARWRDRDHPWLALTLMFVAWCALVMLVESALWWATVHPG